MFVNAIMYYKVKDATSAVANVDDYACSAKLLAATTLRNILGTKTLGDILAERESIAHDMQVSLDEATDPWGVYIERVEVKDVRVPEQLQRAMAAEAEAAREARAKVIAAEGEHKASRALRHAAEVIAECPGAIQVWKFIFINKSEVGIYKYRSCYFFFGIKYCHRRHVSPVPSMKYIILPFNFA